MKEDMFCSSISDAKYSSMCVGHFNISCEISAHLANNYFFKLVGIINNIDFLLLHVTLGGGFNSILPSSVNTPLYR